MNGKEIKIKSNLKFKFKTFRYNFKVRSHVSSSLGCAATAPCKHGSCSDPTLLHSQIIEEPRLVRKSENKKI